ncbi:MAG: hypothetical protein AAB731_02780, partial [Patescibacteria group bacterium]
MNRNILWGKEAIVWNARFDRAAAALRWKREKIPGWIDAPYADVHHELQSFLDETPDGSFSLVAAPRGHGKTSIVTVGEVLRRAFEGEARFIVIGGQCADRARETLRDIRGAIEDNPAFEGMYKKGKPWSGRELTLILPQTEYLPQINTDKTQIGKEKTNL